MIARRADASTCEICVGCKTSPTRRLPDSALALLPLVLCTAILSFGRDRPQLTATSWARMATTLAASWSARPSSTSARRAAEDGDCNDEDGWANPEQAELCDGIDDDCDGLTDEGCAASPVQPAENRSSASGCEHGGSCGSGGTSLASVAALPLCSRRRSGRRR
jgi:hypothetical protein